MAQNNSSLEGIVLNGVMQERQKRLDADIANRQAEQERRRQVFEANSAAYDEAHRQRGGISSFSSDGNGNFSWGDTNNPTGAALKTAMAAQQKALYDQQTKLQTSINNEIGNIMQQSKRQAAQRQLAMQTYTDAMMSAAAQNGGQVPDEVRSYVNRQLGFDGVTTGFLQGTGFMQNGSFRARMGQGKDRMGNIVSNDQIADLATQYGRMNMNKVSFGDADRTALRQLLKSQGYTDKELAKMEQIVGAVDSGEYARNQFLKGMPDYMKAVAEQGKNLALDPKASAENQKRANDALDEWKRVLMGGSIGGEQQDADDATVGGTAGGAATHQPGTATTDKDGNKIEPYQVREWEGEEDITDRKRSDGRKKVYFDKTTGKAIVTTKNVQRNGKNYFELGDGETYYGKDHVTFRKGDRIIRRKKRDDGSDFEVGNDGSLKSSAGNFKPGEVKKKINEVTGDTEYIWNDNGHLIKLGPDDARKRAKEFIERQKVDKEDEETKEVRAENRSKMKTGAVGNSFVGVGTGSGTTGNVGDAYSGAAKSIASSAASLVRDGAEKAFGALKEYVSEPLRKGVQSVVETGKGAAKALQNQLGDAYEVAKQSGKPLKEAAKEVGKGVFGIGRQSPKAIISDEDRALIDYKRKKEAEQFVSDLDKNMSTGKSRALTASKIRKASMEAREKQLAEDAKDRADMIDRAQSPIRERQRMDEERHEAGMERTIANHRKMLERDKNVRESMEAERLKAAKDRDARGLEYRRKKILDMISNGSKEDIDRIFDEIAAEYDIDEFVDGREE